MNGRGRRAWLKLWAYKTIHGTTTKELDPAERWCWIGLLCLAADSPISGTVCIAQGLPYTTDQLAHLLAVTPVALDIAIGKMAGAGKISVTPVGIQIINWEHYQGDYIRVQKYRTQRVANVTPNVTPEGDVANVTPNVTPEGDVTNVTPNVTSPTRRRGRGGGEGRGVVQSRPIDQNENVVAPAVVGLVAAAYDKKLAAFVSVYENGIGLINAVLAEELEALAAQYPTEWFERAVREAVAYNRKSLKYVAAILERWERDGLPPKASPSSRPPGRRRPHDLPTASELKKAWGAE